MRVKIFVDFWNFQLAWNHYHKCNGATDYVRIPWETTLPNVLTNLIGREAVYAGTHVYASVDKRKVKDRSLSNFLHHMNGFRGYNVTVKERKPASPIYCPECRKEISECPHCDQTILRSVEKGVDAAIIIDMIKLAIDERYDRGILLSADRDFVGAVLFIQERMKRIHHVWFKGEAITLQNACWAHNTFESIMGQLLPETE